MTISIQSPRFSRLLHLWILSSSILLYRFTASNCEETLHCPRGYTEEEGSCVYRRIRQPTLRCPPGYRSVNRRGGVRAERSSRRQSPSSTSPPPPDESALVTADLRKSEDEEEEVVEEEAQCEKTERVSPSPQCTQGGVLTEGGMCLLYNSIPPILACPLGYRLNHEGRGCESEKAAPPRYVCGDGGNEGEEGSGRLDESGSRCVKRIRLKCPSGSVQTSEGCSTTDTLQSTPLCPEGASLIDGNSCQILDTSVPSVSCLPGYSLATDGSLACIGTEIVPPVKLCEDGETGPDIFGQCEKTFWLSPLLSCPPGYQMSTVASLNSDNGDPSSGLCRRKLTMSPHMMCSLPDGSTTTPARRGADCEVIEEEFPIMSCPEGFQLNPENLSDCIPASATSSPIDAPPPPRPTTLCPSGYAADPSGGKCTQIQKQDSKRSCPVGHRLIEDADDLRACERCPMTLGAGNDQQRSNCIYTEASRSCSLGYRLVEEDMTTCARTVTTRPKVTCQEGYQIVARGIDGAAECVPRSRVAAIPQCREDDNYRITSDRKLCRRTRSITPSPTCPASYNISLDRSTCERVEEVAPIETCPNGSDSVDDSHQQQQKMQSNKTCRKTEKVAAQSVCNNGTRFVKESVGGLIARNKGGIQRREAEAGGGGGCSRAVTSPSRKTCPGGWILRPPEEALKEEWRCERLRTVEAASTCPDGYATFRSLCVRSKVVAPSEECDEGWEREGYVCVRAALEKEGTSADFVLPIKRCPEGSTENTHDVGRNKGMCFSDRLEEPSIVACPPGYQEIKERVWLFWEREMCTATLTSPPTKDCPQNFELIKEECVATTITSPLRVTIRD